MTVNVGNHWPLPREWTYINNMLHWSGISSPLYSFLVTYAPGKGNSICYRRCIPYIHQSHNVQHTAWTAQSQSSLETNKIEIVYFPYIIRINGMFIYNIACKCSNLDTPYSCHIQIQHVDWFITHINNSTYQYIRRMYLMHTENVVEQTLVCYNAFPHVFAK